MTRILLAALLVSAGAAPAVAQKKLAEIRQDIPYGRPLRPKMEESVFAVCSKQGMRILVSRDDGRTWKQTFLGTDSLEDGGWHGRFAVYGMAATEGVIAAFAGWGAPGVYIGSDDGVHWSHLGEAPAKLGSVWGAAGGNGILLTSADQWRGMTSSAANFSTWQAHRVKDLLAGGRTHHMICGFGDYRGGRFVVVGDNQHVFYSDDCRSWKHSRIPEAAGAGQDELAYGNGTFLCSFKQHVARSADGGATWTLHEHGLRGRPSWRGLSFVRGEFWLTAQNGSHARRSKDGVDWEDLPRTTPGGRFVEADSGTLINVERRRYDIKRSEDGDSWETVFAAPQQDVTWDTAFAVYARVNTAR